VIGLQYGSNKGASQAGMTPYGASRQIRPEGRPAYGFPKSDGFFDECTLDYYFAPHLINFLM
jgi:Calponin family repeat